MEISSECKSKTENDINMIEDIQLKDHRIKEEKLQENICPNSKMDLENINDNNLPLKESQYQTFQGWAIQNYGENSKTKTVTSKKYNRIRDILNGEESPCSENAKFRFWVKAKGFKLGPASWRNGVVDSKQVLYVPTKVQTAHGTVKEFKRVAIVEDFFDIIYSMHVDPECRGGKHAGQKRTYRAIAETYAFLPREAVTRFLMSCQDCQKRMHLSPDNPASNPSLSPSPSPSPIATHPESEDCNSPNTDFDTALLNYNVPITTTYLNHIKKKIQRKHSDKRVDQNGEDKQNQHNNFAAKYPEISSTLSVYNEENEIGINLSKDSNERKTTLQITSDEMKPSANEHLKQCLTSDKPVDLKKEYNPKMKTTKVGKALSSFLGKKYKSGSESPTESSTSLRQANLYKPYEVVPSSEQSLSPNQVQSKHHSPLPGAIPNNEATTHNPKYNMTFPGDLNPPLNLSSGNVNNTWGKDNSSESLLYVHPGMAYAAQMGYVASQKQSPVVSVLNGTCEGSANLGRQKPLRCEPLYNCQQYITDSQSHPDQEHQSQIKLLTIRQLILGYRESAAFLYRSAQELEQLLLKYS